MRKEGSIGTAAVLAIAAVVGFTVYPSGPPRSGDTGRTAEASKSGAITKKGGSQSKPAAWCDDLAERLGTFLEVKDPSTIVHPGSCDAPPDSTRSQSQGQTSGANSQAPGNNGKPVPEPPKSQPAQKPAVEEMKFIIALLPDPLHTHLPVLFDQFTSAIQEAGQDEKYDFDSSWLPWQDQEPDYALYADREESERIKEMREQQPGVILFRKATPQTSAIPPVDTMLPEYRHALIVFVVGEDATHGVHREQFRNAVDWIHTLAPEVNQRPGAVSILGPSFSGSLPSLAQLLDEQAISKIWNLQRGLPPAQSHCPQFAIYSGAVSDAQAAEWFRSQLLKCSDGKTPQVVFHSFVADDDTLLNQFCGYMAKEQWEEFSREKVVVISEDETAYGSAPPASFPPQPSACASKFMRIFYPRDISALRGAYQTKSIFDSGLPSQPADSQRRNLPTDLADPAGEVHDSIKSYGGNQTPQMQEAFLLQMVAALRDFHARYLILRSSNALDQVFLTNFLRRTYPDGRIVIVGSDLLFSRERGATGLSGTMTLSTYPLSATARRWMDYSQKPSSDRVFSSDQSEGTYLAFRMLLKGSVRYPGPRPDECHLVPSDKIFLPPISCSGKPSIPDYQLPYWLNSNSCTDIYPDAACAYDGPAVWLSAVGQNKLWPLAVLRTGAMKPRAVPTQGYRCEKLFAFLSSEELSEEYDTTREESPWEKLCRDPNIGGSSNNSTLGRRPEMPLVMKVFWLVLVAFAAFHAWCCRSGSFTAKPSFRALFAGTSAPHQMLVFTGTCALSFLAIVTAFSCASFTIPAYALYYPWFGLLCALVVLALALTATLGSSGCCWRISRSRLTARYGPPESPASGQHHFENARCWRKNALQCSVLLILLIVLFALSSILPIERTLRPANHFLGSWRGMNLFSGISWLIPLLALLVGAYASVWLALHGMALFGMDHPLLPLSDSLRMRGELEFDQAGNRKVAMLSMFSREASQAPIEALCQPWNGRVFLRAGALAFAFFAIAWGTAGGFPIRSLGSHNYSCVVLIWLLLCCGLLLAEAWRLYSIWQNLRILLVFLDRLPLRRTLAALHGFSWGSVWKMGGNVLELRYKLISRQIECMNHTVESIEKAFRQGLVDPAAAQAAMQCKLSLEALSIPIMKFADWYAANMKNPDAGDLQSFRKVQREFARASGHIFARLLVPHWRKEGLSLIQLGAKPDKSGESQDAPPPAEEPYIQNAEEFVCLNYLAFVQNVLGRIRTVTIAIVVLFSAVAVAISSYPFDPRQALSAVLVALLLVIGAAIVWVYAGMYRDATLSHVTNTKPGELGAEFWFKLVTFGFAPVLGLLARIFPSITDFLFSWLQPSISALK